MQDAKCTSLIHRVKHELRNMFTVVIKYYSWNRRKKNVAEFMRYINLQVEEAKCVYNIQSFYTAELILKLYIVLYESIAWSEL